MAVDVRCMHSTLLSPALTQLYDSDIAWEGKKIPGTMQLPEITDKGLQQIQVIQNFDIANNDIFGATGSPVSVNANGCEDITNEKRTKIIHLALT